MTPLIGIKRGSNDGISLNSMILLSFLLHALLLSIIFLSPTMPSPRWTFGPVYSVNLVSLPSYIMENKPITSISEEVVEIDSRDRSIVLKKDFKKDSPLPIERITTRRKSIKKVDHAIEKLRKKNQASSDVPRGTVEVSMKMKVYYSIIWSEIKGKWALPKGILPDENIEAVISAKILKGGTVTDLSFEKQSGNKFFDESAMRAIKKASPLTPLPEWIKEESVEIGIRFHSSEPR